MTVVKLEGSFLLLVHIFERFLVLLLVCLTSYSLNQDNQQDGLPEPFLRGLSTARLSGRAQIIYDSSSNSSTLSMVNGAASGDLIFYLDGAHSPESMEACGRWFATVVKDDKNLFSPHSCLKTRIGEEVRENGFMPNGNKESTTISKQVISHEEDFQCFC